MLVSQRDARYQRGTNFSGTHGAGKAVPSCDVHSHSAPWQPWDSLSLEQHHCGHSSPAEGCCAACHVPPATQLWQGSRDENTLRCGSSTYRPRANYRGKTCDQQRTHVGKMTHSVPLCRVPGGHGQVSQAELLLQKQWRLLEKKLGSLDEERNP